MTKTRIHLAECLRDIKHAAQFKDSPNPLQSHRHTIEHALLLERQVYLEQKIAREQQEETECFELLDKVMARGTLLDGAEPAWMRPMMIDDSYTGRQLTHD